MTNICSIINSFSRSFLLYLQRFYHSLYTVAVTVDTQEMGHMLEVKIMKLGSFASLNSLSSFFAFL